MKLLQCKYSSKSSHVIASGKLTHEIYFSRTLEERIVVDIERIFEIFSYIITSIYKREIYATRCSRKLIIR